MWCDSDLGGGVLYKDIASATGDDLQEGVSHATLVRALITHTCIVEPQATPALATYSGVGSS